MKNHTWKHIGKNSRLENCINWNDVSLLSQKNPLYTTADAVQIVEFLVFVIHFVQDCKITSYKYIWMCVLYMRVCMCSWVFHLACLALPEPLIAFLLSLIAMLHFHFIYSVHFIRTKATCNMNSDEKFLYVRLFNARAWVYKCLCCCISPLSLFLSTQYGRFNILFVWYAIQF